MLQQEEKENIIQKYRVHKKDTGSDQVQAALLTERIKRLLQHLKKNPKDLHSKRGLLKLVSKRRKVLKHLKAENEEGYKQLLKKLGLKK